MNETHKSRLGAVIVDCETDDLSQAATFWGRALGLQPEAAEQLANPKYVRLEPGAANPQSEQPRAGQNDDVLVILQKVSHPSRVHLDIETNDIEAEVVRLQGLGATLVSRLERWAVMEAPTGHRFCVIGPNRPGFEEGANRWCDDTDD